MSVSGIQVDERITPQDLTAARASETLVELATASGYSVTATGPGRYQFSRSYRASWVMPCVIIGALFLGLGLLLLLVPKRTETCMAVVSEDRRGVSVHLSGSLRPDTLNRMRVSCGAVSAAAPEGGSTRSAVVGQSATIAGSPGAVSYPDLLPHHVSPRSAQVSAVRPAPAILPQPGASGDQLVSYIPPGGGTESTVLRSSVVARRLSVPDAPREAGPAVHLAQQAVPVAEGIVVGRNPAQSDRFPGARKFRLDDQSLSKTHAAFRLNGGLVEVCDLASTNGTRVESDNGRVTPCVAGEWMAVPPGAVVLFGDQRASVSP